MTRASNRPAAEVFLASLVLLGIATAGWRFAHDGYLPQPFYYQPAQTLMDGYTTAFWANRTVAHDAWRTLYPPMSFVLLKVFSTNSCYRLDPMIGRACDPAPAAMLVGFFVLNAVLVHQTYRRADPRTALPRAVAMSLGLPMLYALERGNLLIPCFTAFVLGYGDLLKARWLRAVALAASINFKPYLLFSLIPFIQRRQWRWILACGLAGLALYLASYLVVRSGTPLQIWANDARYGAATSRNSFADLYFATSYWPLIRSLRAGMLGPVTLPANLAGGIALTLASLLRVTQFAALGLLVAGVFRPSGVDIRRFGAMAAGVSFTAFTTGSSGYALIFFLFLVFFEPWRGPVRVTVLVLAYMLCLPVDHILISVIHAPAQSFLSHRIVMTNFGISVGQLLRPAIVQLMLVGLIFLNGTALFGKAQAKEALPGRPAAGGPRRR